MRKLAKLFTCQSRQIANNSVFVCFAFIQHSGTVCTNSMVWWVPNSHIHTCNWAGKRSLVWENVMGPPNSPGVVLKDLPGHFLLSSTCRDVGRIGQVLDHGAVGVFSWGFSRDPQPGGLSTSVDRGATQHHGTRLSAEARWPEELVVAAPGHPNPGGLDLMVSSLGTWKPLIDFCHCFASPSWGSYWNTSSWTVIKLARVVSFNQQ